MKGAEDKTLVRNAIAGSVRIERNHFSLVLDEVSAGDDNQVYLDLERQQSETIDISCIAPHGKLYNFCKGEDLSYATRHTNQDT
jgi:hypothetical protein